MNILLVPDKFKGSLTAREVIAAIEEGLYRLNPEIKTFGILASDGGDGFLKSIAHYLAPEKIVCDTVDPLGRSITAPYLFDASRKTAYIELAQASGLVLLRETDRDVTETSTYGTGLQIKHALAKGATQVYIGLGGSATNDAGTGIAAALGVLFYTGTGEKIIPKGKDLGIITDLDDRAMEAYKNVSFFAVNDVQNPLFGENGAAFVYGKQKGATDTQLHQLDEGLRGISALVKARLRKDIALLPGSGAAGGAAYGLKAFFNAKFIGGTEFILGVTDFFDRIRSQQIDAIITGEGKIDTQTKNGKLIKGITVIAERYEIPVLAVCGMLTLDAEGVKALGLKAAVEIRDRTKPETYSFEHAGELISQKIPYLMEGIL